MGTDEHSLTLQKETREVLDLLMVPHGMLSIYEMTETLGSLCMGGLSQQGKDDSLILLPCLQSFLTGYIWFPSREVLEDPGPTPTPMLWV